MDSPSWLSVLPPLLAIGLAVWTRKVIVSLLAGIYLGRLIIGKGQVYPSMVHTLKTLLGVMDDPGSLKVIFFCGLVGALIKVISDSGSPGALVQWAEKRGFLTHSRRIQLLSAGTGLAIFIETSVSSLIVGSVYRPLFDRQGLRREKLAYICDSTSAPVNLLVPFNAWGAFIVGLIALEGMERPLRFFLECLPYNFYVFFAILTVFYSIVSDKEFRPGGKDQVPGEPPASSPPLRIRPGIPLRYLVIPILTLVLAMPVFMLVTGGGRMVQGKGAASVFWAVIAALLVTLLLYRLGKILDWKELSFGLIKGFQGMWAVMLLMLLAFAIGDITRELGTGPYLARLAGYLPDPLFTPLVLFALAGMISFSTGTSWGTYAIMIPIALSMGSLEGINLPASVAAVLGGGVFGDHASPISDTTIIASLAAGCHHIDHVRTQLPYALAAAGFSLMGYLAIGFI